MTTWDGRSFCGQTDSRLGIARLSVPDTASAEAVKAVSFLINSVSSLPAATGGGQPGSSLVGLGAPGSLDV